MARPALLLVATIDLSAIVPSSDEMTAGTAGPILGVTRRVTAARHFRVATKREASGALTRDEMTAGTGGPILGETRRATVVRHFRVVKKREASGGPTPVETLTAHRGRRTPVGTTRAQAARPILGEKALPIAPGRTSRAKAIGRDRFAGTRAQDGATGKRREAGTPPAGVITKGRSGTPSRSRPCAREGHRPRAPEAAVADRVIVEAEAVAEAGRLDGMARATRARAAQAHVAVAAVPTRRDRPFAVVHAVMTTRRRETRAGLVADRDL